MDRWSPKTKKSSPWTTPHASPPAGPCKLDWLTLAANQPSAAHYTPTSDFARLVVPFRKPAPDSAPDFS
eukprot:827270-Amphidinium_carterae.1